jgi:hypothetical protein
MTDKVSNEKVTLTEIIKDLGWFPTLLSTLIGATSLFSIFEMAFKDFRLNATLLWIVDGYNRLTAVMEHIIQPYILPAIVWINAQFGWRLVLDPIWRPIFLIVIIPILALARIDWREGARIRAVGYAGVRGAFSLITSLFLGFWISAREASHLLPSFVIVFPSLFVVLGVGLIVLGLVISDDHAARWLRGGLGLLSGFLAAEMIVVAAAVIKSPG